MRDDDRPALDHAALFRAAPVQLSVFDRDLRVVDVNDLFVANTGVAREALVGQPVFEVLPAPDDIRRPVEAAMRAALAGEPTEVVEIPYAVPDGSGGTRDAWWTARHVPLHDAAGTVRWVVQSAEVVTDHVRMRAARDAVQRELQHRIANSFALAASIASQVARRSSDLEAFLPRYVDRMAALSRTQLSVSGVSDLAAALRDEIAAAAGEAAAFDLDGPPVDLADAQAQTLALGLHELVTNAVKHGAFARPGGTLAVRWSGGRADAPLRFEWDERAPWIAPSDAPKGFGTTILDAILPQQLDLAAERRIEAGRFRYALHPRP